jgi:putative intracellular protease/amidase
LIAETIIIVAVRAFPGYSIACHSPQIVHHALLTDGKSATALPVERRALSTAMTITLCGLTAFFSVSRSI